ncbi:TatD family hydrolase [Marinobacterium arenosum]|uniref:TatD family hydrolase n=1 Tax=Marinobacterium arenosum TaxID=2862496 RepID=UPI001C980F2D|nr:TatD family hydrolase [Marinobacterium arenosum]MBY4675632.1 TatD family hydrolase [Marinobacterium arenosum]
MLIDTHCHLNFPVFSERRAEVITEAARQGVGKIVVPGVSAKGWAELLKMTESSDDLFPALGLHPCFISEHKDSDLRQLEEMLAGHRDSVVAVGEIGLDLFISDPQFEQQLALFEAQLALAERFELPVLLHVRKAHDQVLARLRRLKLQRGGIVHAFSGSRQQAEHYLKLGFKLGFGGAISYSRATKLRRLAAELPLEALVLETDAPDMPLADYRDRPNEPARVRQVAELIASLRGIELRQVAAVTSATASCLLGL